MYAFACRWNRIDPSLEFVSRCTYNNDACCMCICVYKRSLSRRMNFRDKRMFRAVARNWADTARPLSWNSINLMQLLELTRFASFYRYTYIDLPIGRVDTIRRVLSRLSKSYAWRSKSFGGRIRFTRWFKSGLKVARGKDWCEPGGEMARYERFVAPLAAVCSRTTVSSAALTTLWLFRPKNRQKYAKIWEARENRRR